MTSDKLTQIAGKSTSRRGFLGGSAKIAGAGAVAAALGASAFSMASAHTTRPPDCDFNDDIEVLNYALTLEHLEAAFYVQGQNAFSESQFERGFNERGGIGLDLYRQTGALFRRTDYLYDRFEDIRDHEVTHVQTLESVISSLNGTPVPACSYNFDFSSVTSYLQTAQALENTGVMAYDGAVNCLLNADLIEAGATIATVEARHASFLNFLNSDNPFPAAFDTPKTKCEIFAIASQFIVSCPQSVLDLFSSCSN